MGRPKKILDKEDILRAMARTRSNHSAARYLKVSYPHYKKYAKVYKDQETGKTLFELHKNQSGKGISKIFGDKVTKEKLLEFLTGEGPAYSWSPEKLKNRLLRDGILEEKCNKCGFSERRALDLKPPLLLNFKDGDRANWNLKNIEFLCYNCYFLYVDNIFSAKEISYIEDYSFDVSEDTFEIDEETLEYFRELGLTKETEPSGSEFIDYL